MSDDALSAIRDAGGTLPCPPLEEEGRKNENCYGWLGAQTWVNHYRYLKSMKEKICSTPWSEKMKTLLQPSALVLTALLTGCATVQYTPLAEVEQDQVEQLRENAYRVEYRVSPFTPQEQLDIYLRRRCAELTLREGYDYFHLGQRFDVLMLSRRTSMTVTMFKGEKPAGSVDLFDARAVLSEQP